MGFFFCCLIIWAFSVCTHKKDRWCVRLTMVVEIKLQPHHLIYLDVPFLSRWCVSNSEVWLVLIDFSLFFFLFFLLFLPQITYWSWKKLYQPSIFVSFDSILLLLIAILYIIILIFSNWILFSILSLVVWFC
jgi:hypothetical protein